MQTNRLLALIIGALFLVAGAAVAFAQSPGDGSHANDMGYDRGGMMGHGSGQGMGPGMMGHGRYNDSDLTKEQRDKLDAAREKFWTDNRKLRNDIEDKQDELYTELKKENVDEAKVTTLQKELSKLQSDFDQKLIQHKLEVHKIAPDLFRGHGYGRMHGGGSCWQQ